MGAASKYHGARGNVGELAGQVRGRLTQSAPLRRFSWFRTGGPADWLFEPADTQDLAGFLSALSPAVPRTVIGVGSNLLVRDGGVRGVVICLPPSFAGIESKGLTLTVGAGAMDVHVARFAAGARLAGFEFLVGIPGTIGGAVRMNAGAYGREMADCVTSVEAVSFTGEIARFSLAELGYAYRHCSLPKSWIITKVWLKGTAGDGADIKAKMQEIMTARSESQPIGTRTGGSTFKNPQGGGGSDLSAWQLVDKAGCRGVRIGDAVMSEKHCNFMVNAGRATATDIETLGETVRLRVKEATGVALEWEIERIGDMSGTIVECTSAQDATLTPPELGRDI